MIPLLYSALQTNRPCCNKCLDFQDGIRSFSWSRQLPLRIDHFHRKYSDKFKRPARPSAKALELLARYDWPGNVRELENEILKAMTLAADEKKITETHLSDKIHASSKQITLPKKTEGTLQELTEQLEQHIIRETLEQTKGNRSETARRLGLSRQGLVNKLTRYNI